MKDFKKILELLRKTGDRFLMEDDKGNLFVVLSANDYERILLSNNEVRNFSEEELLNKINKDIAVWKASQEDEKLLDNWHDLEGELAENQPKKAEDQYYFEPVEDEE